jgi:hypothetical protein
MFMLVYLAMFGIKKGSIIAYESSWFFNFNIFNSTLGFYKKSLKEIFGYRFQYTAITSRSTSYFLLLFWLFFFFFGD